MAKIKKFRFTKTQYEQIVTTISRAIDTVENIRKRDKTGMRKTAFQEVLDALSMAYMLAVENKQR